MKKSDFAVLPFNTTRIKDKFLVSNLLGGWDLLEPQEFRRLSTYTVGRDTPLFHRLYGHNVIADENNFKKLVADYRNLNSNLFADTSLHIAVVTTRCNLACGYCQTSIPEPQDMDHEVAVRVLKYLFDVANLKVTLEFQGGEPLLNWDIVKFLVENARGSNVNKDLRITLVTNLTLMDAEKMRFLAKNDVEICSSLDGPREIHDKNRVFKGGKGTYAAVTKNMRMIRERFKKPVHLLPTITKASLKAYKKIVDEYVRWGQQEISLRPVNKMGLACSHWPDLGYSADEFCAFYRNAMDYILDLNKKGVPIAEKMARVILRKVLLRQDAGYVEMMNPCGAGRATLVYMPNGDCYPCDESRMVGEEMFRLGNILKENYTDMMKKENLLHLLEASSSLLWDYKSAFSPWTGTCPVVNFATQKNIVPKIWCSSLHKIYDYQFRYIFEKIAESPKDLEVFRSWTEGRYDEKETARRKKIQ